MYPHKFTYFSKNHIFKSQIPKQMHLVYTNIMLFFLNNHNQLSKFYHVYENEQEDKNKYN